MNRQSLLDYGKPLEATTAEVPTPTGTEVVVKISSFFGATGGAEVIRGYRLPESKEIYGELVWRDILKTAAKSFYLVPRTIFRCMRMRERWPWLNFEPHLDTPLVRIRADFGIDVSTRSRI